MKKHIKFSLPKSLKFWPPIIVMLFLAMGCANNMYLTGVDPDPNGPTEVFYVPASHRKISTEKIDTSKAKWNELAKELDNAMIQDFGKISNRFITAIDSCDKNYAFEYCDWDLDGVMDLVAINRQGFTATDMYILSGATEFKGFLLQQPIGLPWKDDKTDFAMNDSNRDGIPDLYVFERMANDSLNVNILSGKRGVQGPPFFTSLKDFTLNIPDPRNQKDFKVKDMDFDSIPDLIVIDKNALESTGKKETRVSVYTGSSGFTHLLKSKVTPSFENRERYKYLLHDIMIKYNQDLIGIDNSTPEATKINIFNGANDFKIFAAQDTLALAANDGDAVFFGANEVPKKSDNPGKVTYTLNRRPIVRSGAGPQDLSDFLGKWETLNLWHSADGNFHTGITIEMSPEPAEYKGMGWQGITLTFEDKFQIKFEGKDGNVECTYPKHEYTITDIEKNHFFLRNNRTGRHWKVDRYDPNMTMGILLVHNRSTYDAAIQAEWVETGFGGSKKNVKTPWVYIARPGSPNDVSIYDDHVFTIPVNAENVIIKVVDKNNKGFSIDYPPIDNGCYKLIGSIEDGLSNPNYQYYTRDCSESRIDAFKQKAEEIKNGDLYTTLTKHIGKLVASGDIANLNLDMKNPQSYREAMNKVITPQISKVLQSKNSGLSMIDEETRENWPSLIQDNEVLLASTNDFLPEHSSFTTNELNRFLPNDIEGGGISSFSVGIGGSVELVIGGVQGDLGLVFDVSGSSNRYGPRFYGTVGPILGPELGIEGNVVFGLWTTPIQNMEDGWAVGFGFEVVIEVGITALFWFNLHDMHFTGFTIAIDAGAEAGLDVVFSHTGYGPLPLNTGN